MIFATLMPILHKAADEVNVFGLDNVDEKRVQDTYNELLIAQMTIYTELIKPYVDHIPPRLISTKNRKMLRGLNEKPLSVASSFLSLC